MKKNIPDIYLKRVYQAASEEDGCRLLVDKLWPRGIRSADLHLDDWVKTLAPSTSLRKWYAYQSDRWLPFQEKYLHELEANPSLSLFLETYKDKKRITLLYAARDGLHNHAIVLKSFLEKAFARKEANQIDESEDCQLDQ